MKLKNPRLRIAALILLALLLAAGWVAWGNRPDGGGGPEPRAGSLAAGAPAEGRDPAWAGSQSCRDCHPRAFEAWAGSHHALAERPLVPEIDRPAFVPGREIRHG